MFTYVLTYIFGILDSILCLFIQSITFVVLRYRLGLPKNEIHEIHKINEIIPPT